MTTGPVKENPMTTTPLARPTDPETSHEAAEALGLDPDKLRRSQADVYWVLARHGAMTDAELIVVMNTLARQGLVAHQSHSGIRTRRAELVRRGSVVDTGKRDTMPSGRSAIIWGLA